MKTFFFVFIFTVQATITLSQKFHSPEGRFKIAFEAEPVVTTQDIPTEIGAIQMTMFMHEKSLEEAFMAAYSDYPAELVNQLDPYDLLESAKDGAVSNLGVTISEEKKITIQGYPAWDFKGNGLNNLRLVSRIIMVGNRLYQAMYLKQGTGIDAGKRFVRSLEIEKRSPNQQIQQVQFNTPARIELINPKQERGFTIVAEKDREIKALVTDPEGVQSVFINSTEAYSQGNGYYSINNENISQLSSITIVAIDQTGNESKRKFNLKHSSKKINSSKTPEKRLALLIGNSDYKFGGKLLNPVNDIRSMDKALRRLGFEVLIYENCGQRDMKKAMDTFGQKLNGFEVGLFFYAGHGIQVDGRNYLVPIDAQLKNKTDVDYDCVPTGRLMGKMEESKNKTNIIILDACRDNPFERSWSRTTKGSGLAFMNAPSGTLIAYATSPGKTASDGSGSGNGLYTSALLKHIHTPNITALQLFQRVRKEVMNKSNNEQTPWESTSLSGDFYFKK